MKSQIPSLVKPQLAIHYVSRLFVLLKLQVRYPRHVDVSPQYGKFIVVFDGQTKASFITGDAPNISYPRGRKTISHTRFLITYAQYLIPHSHCPISNTSYLVPRTFDPKRHTLNHQSQVGSHPLAEDPSAPLHRRKRKLKLTSGRSKSAMDFSSTQGSYQY